MITNSDIIKLLVKVRPTLDDADALRFKDMYPKWKEGITVKVDQRYQYGDKLYKVRQGHTTLAGQEPGIATAALWAVIDEEHAGTIGDPIPAVRGMEYTKGLYYIEDGVTYLMNRKGMNDGETIVLQHLPSELVGQYFIVV